MTCAPRTFALFASSLITAAVAVVLPAAASATPAATAVTRATAAPPQAAPQPAAAKPARPVLGHVTRMTRTGTRVRVSGWAVDKAHRRHRLHLRITVDGHTRVRLTTTITRPALARKYKAAKRIGFRASVSVGYGTHTVCVRSASPAAVLSCSRITIAKPAVTPGRRVAALAAKQVGKRYVDGAAGPSSFDCSGLVRWVYSKTLGKKLPHNAQAQASRFRRIPASRAVAGDLVFFHDGSGHVYHVGILAAKRGWMYAAATPHDGVRHQRIWSTAVTYGTVLHS